MARTTKLLVSALMVFSGLAYGATPTLPLNHDFKRDIKAYCKSKPDAERKQCLNAMAGKYVALKKHASDPDNADYIHLCLDYGKTSKSPLSVALICTDDIANTRKRTGYDQIAHFPYIKSRMRPHWVNRCGQDNRADINGCLQREEGFFNVFWNAYTGTKTTRKKMDKCLTLLNPGWDFESVNQCNNREM